MDVLFLFLFGTWLGWLSLAVVSACVIFSLEFDSGKGALGSLVLFVALFWFVAGQPAVTISGFFHWLDGNWFKLIVFVGLYVVIGMVWAFPVKWYFYCQNRSDTYEQNQRANANSAWNLFGDADRKKYDGKLVNYTQERYDYPPHPKRNKARLTMWMAYWPWSFTWTVLNDPLKHAWRWFYNKFSGLMLVMSTKIAAGRFEEFRS